MEQPVDDLVECPVATHREQQRRAGVGGRMGEVGGLHGPRGDPHVVADLPRVELRGQRRPDAREGASTGSRIGDDHDVGRCHPRAVSRRRPNRR